eukprot:m.81990 g.81990  ORF g.81990 m.81990 type:complete len:114 (-) comp14589_c0_seq1:78-419(-)
MVKDAELHADEDAKRKENIEAVNSAESIINDTEKNLTDFADDIESEDKTKVQEQIEELRKALSSDEPDAEEIRRLSGEVQQSSLKAFDVAYKKRAAANDSGNDSGSSDDTNKQ